LDRPASSLVFPYTTLFRSEGVKKAKGELYDYLQSHQGQLFVQANNGHLMEMLRAKDIDESTVISYGFSKLNTVYGRLITADPYLSIARSEEHTSELQSREN